MDILTFIHTLHDCSIIRHYLESYLSNFPPLFMPSSPTPFLPFHPLLLFSSHPFLYLLLFRNLLLSEGKAEEIDCTYVSSGQPLDVTAYVKSKQGFGKSFVDFFSDGGLIKFNPFK